MQLCTGLESATNAVQTLSVENPWHIMNKETDKQSYPFCCLCTLLCVLFMCLFRVCIYLCMYVFMYVCTYVYILKILGI